MRGKRKRRDNNGIRLRVATGTVATASTIATKHGDGVANSEGKDVVCEEVHVSTRKEGLTVYNVKREQTEGGQVVDLPRHDPERSGNTE